MKATSIFGALPLLLNHMGFHLGFFIASFFVPRMDNPVTKLDTNLDDCILQLQIMHGVCFLICLSQRIIEIVNDKLKFIREMLTLIGFSYYFIILMKAAQILQVYYFWVNGDNGTVIEKEQMYFLNNEVWVVAGVLFAMVCFLITNYIFMVRFYFTDNRTAGLQDVLGQNFWNARIYINLALFIILPTLNIIMPNVSSRQTDTEKNLLWTTLIIGIGGAVSFLYILLITMLGKGTKCKVMIWLINDAIWFIFGPIGLLIYSCIVMSKGEVQCATLICFMLSIASIFVSIFLNYLSLGVFLSLYRMEERKDPEPYKAKWIVGTERDISLKEDIYSMAIVICQSDEVLRDSLADLKIPKQYAPSPEMKSEIQITAVVCFGSQLLISTMLLTYFKQAAKENTQVEMVDTWRQMVRLICAILFHITFEQELRYAITNMKFIAYHSDRFEAKWTAFMMCLLQGSIVIVIEIVNIWNLANITQIDEIVMDYIALGIISEFDDCFFELYTNTQLAKLLQEGSFQVLKFRKAKKKFADLDAKQEYSKMQEEFEELTKKGIGNLMAAAKAKTLPKQQNEGGNKLDDVDLDNDAIVEQRLDIVNEMQNHPKKDAFELRKSMQDLATDIEANKFSEMNCTDKSFVLLFKFFRFWFITVYYYVFPYIVIIFSISQALYSVKAKEAMAAIILQFEDPDKAAELAAAEE